MKCLIHLDQHSFESILTPRTVILCTYFTGVLLMIIAMITYNSLLDQSVLASSLTLLQVSSKLLFEKFERSVRSKRVDTYLAVVAEWVNVSIINPILKVEGSNPGASILKLVFSNFQSGKFGLEYKLKFWLPCWFYVIQPILRC